MLWSSSRSTLPRHQHQSGCLRAKLSWVLTAGVWVKASELDPLDHKCNTHQRIINTHAKTPAEGGFRGSLLYVDLTLKHLRGSATEEFTVTQDLCQDTRDNSVSLVGQ